MEVTANGSADAARTLEVIGGLPPAAVFASPSAPPLLAIEPITLAEAFRHRSIRKR
jgi:hypothetical protein